MEAVSQAAGAGDIAPFLAYVEKALQTEVGLHSRLQLSEASIQFFMLGAARLLKGFKATAEEEALGIGFLDVVIRPTTESDSPGSRTSWNSSTSLRQRERRRPLRRSWTTPVGSVRFRRKRPNASKPQKARRRLRRAGGEWRSIPLKTHFSSGFCVFLYEILTKNVGTVYRAE